MNKTDKIIELKNLLDSGLISQSDFDRLKKQIFEGENNFTNEINKISQSEFNEIIQQRRNNDLGNINSKKKCSQCGYDNALENTHCQSCFAFFENYTTKDIQPQENNAEIQSNNNTKYFLIAGLVLFFIFLFALYFSKSNTNDNESISDEKVVIDSTSDDTSYVEAESAIPSDTTLGFESAKIDTTTINLKKYIGSFTTQTDLFDSKFINYELNRILGSEFYNYKDFVKGSSCGQIIRKGDLIYGDIFIRSAGGYVSIFFINLKDKKMHLFWLNDSIGSSSNCKIYGDKPIPENVIDIILEEMNSSWGHVAKFSSIDSEIYIEFN